MKLNEQNQILMHENEVERSANCFVLKQLGSVQTIIFIQSDH